MIIDRFNVNDNREFMVLVHHRGFVIVTRPLGIPYGFFLACFFPPPVVVVVANSKLTIASRQFLAVLFFRITISS